MKITIAVEGLAECEEALKAIPDAISKQVLERALMTAAEPVAAEARKLAPKRTGRLQQSIAVSTRLSPRQRRQHRKQSPAEAFVGAGPAPHAHLQEFGRAHHRPHPFLRPAVDATGKLVIEIFKREIKAEIDKAAQRLAAKAERIKAKFRA